MFLQPPTAATAVVGCDSNAPASLNVRSGGSGTSGTAGAGLLGIGLRPGVRITPNVSRCLRRPTKLATSLRMLSEGHDFDRCCDQLLLAHCFMEGGSTAGGQRSAGGGSLFSEEGVGLDLAGQEHDAIERQHEAEEALLDAGYGISELGARLLNKAKAVPRLHVALEVERQSAVDRRSHCDVPSIRISTTPAASEPPGNNTATSPAGTAAAVGGGGGGASRAVDDDVATQLYLATYTLDDIRRQEAMLMEEARMIEALQRRFKDDDGGQRLLATNLSGARVLVRSSNARDALRRASPGPGQQHPASPVEQRDSSGAGGNVGIAPQEGHRHGHPHLLDAWKWSLPTTNRVLPPLSDPRLLASSQPACPGSNTTQASGDDGDGALSSSCLLTSAVKLAPLCAPVSFSPGGGSEQSVAVEYVSPLRPQRRTTSDAATSPSPVMPRPRFRSSAAKPPQPQLCGGGPLHVDGVARSAVAEDDGTWTGSDAWRIGLNHQTEPTINDAVVAAVLRASTEAWDTDAAESSPGALGSGAVDADTEENIVWQFERSNCLKDVARQLSAYYGCTN